MEARGLAASTIDRRLSTACGYYRFAHIDRRTSSNPAQYVRRPTVHPSAHRGLDRGELGRFLFAAERFDHAHAALAVLLGLNGLRVSEACDTNIEDMAFERGHRVLRIVGKGNKFALIPLVPRTARTIDLAVGERRDGPILLRRDGQRLDWRTAHRWARSIGKRAGLGEVHPHMLRAAFIMAALDAGVPLREVQIAARHADPRTTTGVVGRKRAPTGSTPGPEHPAAGRLGEADLNGVVAYNFRAAGDLSGWTQEETAQALERLLGQRLPQASISAIERAYEGEHRREFDAHEILAFALAFDLPLVWFFLPPPKDHRTLHHTTNTVSELYAILLGHERQLGPLYDRLRQLGIDEPAEAARTVEAITGSPSPPPARPATANGASRCS